MSALDFYLKLLEYSELLGDVDSSSDWANTAGKEIQNNHHAGLDRAMVYVPPTLPFMPPHSPDSPLTACLLF